MIEGLVSIIIPVFNRPTMIVRAVQSVLNQLYRPLEIIIVDDGSTDNTLDVLKTLNTTHDEVRILTQTNAGPGMARELGRKAAKGEYIQYLDSDDILLPNKLALQVAALQQSPECDVAYGKTERLVEGANAQRQAWKLTGSHRETMFPEFVKSRWWGTSTPLYRQRIVNQIGPWLPLINEEDWEYDCRIASLGTRLAYVDEFVSIQYEHTNHLSDDGVCDPVKLQHRCIARQAMYRSIVQSKIDIPDSAIQHFSKSVFLLCRECAAAGVTEQATDMFKLSIQAAGQANLKHCLFKFTTIMFGWKNSATLVRFLERVK